MRTCLVPLPFQTESCTVNEPHRKTIHAVATCRFISKYLTLFSHLRQTTLQASQFFKSFKSHLNIAQSYLAEITSNVCTAWLADGVFFFLPSLPTKIEIEHFYSFSFFRWQFLYCCMYNLVILCSLCKCLRIKQYKKIYSYWYWAISDLMPAIFSYQNMLKKGLSDQCIILNFFL